MADFPISEARVLDWAWGAIVLLGGTVVALITRWVNLIDVNVKGQGDKLQKVVSKEEYSKDQEVVWKHLEKHSEDMKETREMMLREFPSKVDLSNMESRLMSAMREAVEKHR